MNKPTNPTKLGNKIQSAIKNSFNEESFWITAEISEVKKYPAKKTVF